MKEFVGVIIIWIAPWLGILIPTGCCAGTGTTPPNSSAPTVGLYFGARRDQLERDYRVRRRHDRGTMCFSKAPPPSNFPFHSMTPCRTTSAEPAPGSWPTGTCTAGWYGGADFSVPAGIILSGLIYFLLDLATGYTKRQVQEGNVELEPELFS